jgi:MFS family permease
VKKSAYFAWLAAALFYYYQYILRVSPSVMVTELREAFHLTAEQFSSLGAVYLYAYSLFQIPIGIVIDQIGVRKTVLGSIALCILGNLSLAYSDTLAAVLVSRALIGAGSACAFMSALKIAADWLPSGNRGLFMGMTLTLGTIGALTAGKPLVLLLDAIGWRPTTQWLALVGVALFVLVFATLRLPPVVTTKTPSWRVIRSAILSILRSRPIMIYALVAIGVYTPLAVLADLWGTAFLMERYALPRAIAAQSSMMMYLGLCVGSLILPWMCDRWGILNRTIQICSVGILATFSYLLWGPPLGGTGLTVLLILLGIFCGAEMICFTGAMHYTTPENSGMTLGVVNTLNMLSGAILQQSIGFLLDLQWTGKLDAAGVRIYETHEFQLATSLLLVVVALCCLLSIKLGRDGQLAPQS